MVLFIILTAAAVALFFYFLVNKTKHTHWKDKGVPQGNPTWLLGHNWKTIIRQQSTADLILSLYNREPGTRYTGMYLFNLPILVIKDPDLLKQLTVKDFDHFTDHIQFLPVDSDPLWGKNLFARQGQEWREMRTVLSPAFTSSKMKTMFGLMEECAKNFVQYFLKKDEEIITLEFKDAFTRFANDVIATTAFGINVDSLAEPNNEFYLLGKEVTNVNGIWKNIKFILYGFFPIIKKILKIQIFSDEASFFFRNIIDENIKDRAEKGIVRPDMIQLLFEAQKGTHKEENGVVDTGYAVAQEFQTGKGKIPRELTNEDIAAQAVVFFFAGFESVSGLMCFLIYELVVNRDIQDRLRKEVQSTLEECKGKLTYEALLKMKYMDMVVSETLRKWPNFVKIDRVCTKDYVIEPELPGEKPVHLRKGDPLWLPLLALHWDPNYYPDPQRFDPERFSDENKGNIKPYTYFPFGLGPRNCVGSRFALLETKTVIFHLLLNFEIVPVEKTQIPVKIGKVTFTLNPEGGFWFGLKHIKT